MADAFDVQFSELSDLRPLAEGNFGHLFRARYRGHRVAVKQLLGVEDKAMHKYIEREMTLLKSLRHANIVRYMGMCHSEGQLYIVTEYVRSGDLHEKLHDAGLHLPWRLRTRIALDTCAAVVHLHERDIIHRDLKSKNLLVDGNWRVKVCDFGFARSADSKQYMTLVGTDEWMAPEIFLGDKYDKSVDVFSFGLILFELIMRAEPPERFPGAAYAFDAEAFRRRLPEDCPEELAQCCVDCCRFYPAERPRLEEVHARLQRLLDRLTAEDAGLDLAAEMHYMTIEDAAEDEQASHSSERRRRRKRRSEPDALHSSLDKKARKERRARREERTDERRRRKASAEAGVGGCAGQDAAAEADGRRRSSSAAALQQEDEKKSRRKRKSSSAKVRRRVPDS